MDEDLYTAVVVECGFRQVCFDGYYAIIGQKAYVEERISELREWYPGKDYRVCKLVEES